MGKAEAPSLELLCTWIVGNAFLHVCALAHTFTYVHARSRTPCLIILEQLEWVDAFVLQRNWALWRHNRDVSPGQPDFRACLSPSAPELELLWKAGAAEPSRRVSPRCVLAAGHLYTWARARVSLKQLLSGPSRQSSSSPCGLVVAQGDISNDCSALKKAPVVLGWKIISPSRLWRPRDWEARHSE